MAFVWTAAAKEKTSLVTIEPFAGKILNKNNPYKTDIEKLTLSYDFIPMNSDEPFHFIIG